MSGLQALIGYEGCCCDDEPCPSTLCGLIGEANNGSSRDLNFPPLFTLNPSNAFTLSVNSSYGPVFGVRALTPYAAAYHYYSLCSEDLDCCCNTVGIDDCQSGGACSEGYCDQVQNGDYRPVTSYQIFSSTSNRCVINNVQLTDTVTVQGGNLAQNAYAGDFTVINPVCSPAESSFTNNGCDGESNDWCAKQVWEYNGFDGKCIAELNIDGSGSVPANTNYTILDSKLRIVQVPAFENRPPCDCKCPWMELTVGVSGVIFALVHDHTPFPTPDYYTTILASQTLLVYRKRLVQSKALNYYTYYDWVNDTSEPFHLFKIQSGEDGVHTYCNQNAVNGTKWQCSVGECGGDPECVSTGGTSGTGPTEYIEPYYGLCSIASSETTNASGISAASCVNYPEELQLKLVANLTPTVTSHAPLTGTTAGGTVVVFSGTGLWGCHEVRFDGVLAQNFFVNSNFDTNLFACSAVTPPHAAGLVTVTFSFSWGSCTSTFTYV